MSALFAIVLSVLAIFLILLVLVQRGRGGGLAGALGGMGGSSAFGAKAGDVFTRITVVTAGIWILVCVASVYWAGHRGDALSSGGATTADSPFTVPLGGAGAADKAAPASGPASGTETASPPADSAPANNK
jgi:preprotein translocase subunit SecG